MDGGAVGLSFWGGPARVLQTVGRAFTLLGTAEVYVNSQVNKLFRVEMLIVPKVSARKGEGGKSSSTKGAHATNGKYKAIGHSRWWRNVLLPFFTPV